VAIRHHDTARDHIHIIANRVDQHGRRVPDFRERERGEGIVRDLEREFGLTQVAPSREASRRVPSRGELARFESTSEVSVKARLQEHVDLAARGGPSLAGFAERLSLQGVSVRAHVAATGRLSGLSFELEDVRCKGWDLGRGYSWRGLAARTGLHYEPERDLPALRALGALAVREERAEPRTLPGETVGKAPVREESAPARWEPSARAAGGDPLEGLRQRLREEIESAAHGGPALPEFVRRMNEAAEVQVHANLASTGRLSGLSFELDGVRLKSSEMGRDYAWRALADRHGLTFDPARDRPGLEQLGAVPRGGPAAEPSETPARAVPAYRAAAVLSSRLEVESRVQALTVEGRGLARIVEEARRVLDQRAHMEQMAAVRPATLDWWLREAYASPAAAGKALEKLVDREGPGRAAKVLERSAGQLGRLRGMGLGSLHSAGRRGALVATAHLAGELRRAAGWQERLAAERPAAAAAISRGAAAKGQVERVSAALRQLPPSRSLEAEMVRAVEVLGKRLTARLAPQAVAARLIGHVIRAARELLLGRDDEMSLGR
jgi:Relaxase/Mobilisation nuclease domain